MRPKELAPLLIQCFKAGEQVLLKGKPGYGKTAVIKQAVADAGMDLILSHPAIAEPVDYRGFPARHEDGTHATFLPFGELWRAIQATRPTVFCLDDYGQAPDSVQKATMQLIHGRKLNGYVIPDCVTFCAATNDVKQMSGVNGILEPVKSRFSAIVELEGHVDDWAEWALDHGMPVALVAYMRSPESVLPNGSHTLFDWKPTKELTNSGCPRTWEAVGRMMNAGLKNLELWSGAVGQAAATQFWAWLQVAEKAPDLDLILQDPAGSPIPDQPSLRFLVATGLSRRLTKGNIDRGMTYLQRLDQPYRVLALTDLTRRANREVRANTVKLGESPLTSAAYQRWCLGEGKDIGAGLAG
ncbi:MAG: P-loop NTPase family protein [Limisphaerales bacterium]